MVLLKRDTWRKPAAAAIAAARVSGGLADSAKPRLLLGAARGNLTRRCPKIVATGE